MSYPPGRYKTQFGLKAVVAQVRDVGRVWQLVGTVEIGGVMYLHSWNAYGKSQSGDTKFDLTREP